jgi:ABC-2 type transport system ATP-binding protein
MSIEVKGLCKNYGAQKAVQDLSFSVLAGSIVGFLGPNGAGKSTTFKMIAGYLTPDAGSIAVHGIDVVKDPMTAKKHIGYLAEANPLYHDMYVKEYLHFVGAAHGIEALAAAVVSSIELTGLGNESHKKIGQLSKGYKQRVGLAAALIHNPQVLLLDEPTSGLDPNQIIEIRNVIQAQGVVKTVLFSSHILQEVEAICERVLVLSKGQMVANDSLSNLLNNKHESLESVFRSLTSGSETPINA